MALLSMRSPVARYLLGDLTLDESRRMEESTIRNNKLRREIEVGEEELIASYAVGILRGEYRSRFENNFLSSENRRSEGRKLKLKFAVAWLEKGAAVCPDLTSPVHRYILCDMPPEKEAELEEKLLIDVNCQAQLDAAENELLIAYFHNLLPGHERELFEFNYPSTDRMIRKLRFAHIMREYVSRASVAPSLMVETVLI
jgi:anti-sigma-K factor RskA